MGTWKNSSWDRLQYILLIGYIELRGSLLYCVLQCKCICSVFYGRSWRKRSLLALCFGLCGLCSICSVCDWWSSLPTVCQQFLLLLQQFSVGGSKSGTYIAYFIDIGFVFFLLTAPALDLVVIPWGRCRPRRGRAALPRLTVARARAEEDAGAAVGGRVPRRLARGQARLEEEGCTGDYTPTSFRCHRLLFYTWMLFTP